MATITDTRLQGLTAAEWGDVWPRMLRENARRLALAECADRAREAADQYAAAVALQDPIDPTTLDEGATVGPGERITLGDAVWTNTSGAWLDPATAGPDQYTAGWTPPPRVPTSTPQAGPKPTSLRAPEHTAPGLIYAPRRRTSNE